MIGAHNPETWTLPTCGSQQFNVNIANIATQYRSNASYNPLSIACMAPTPSASHRLNIAPSMARQPNMAQVQEGHIVDLQFQHGPEMVKIGGYLEHGQVTQHKTTKKNIAEASDRKTLRTPF